MNAQNQPQYPVFVMSGSDVKRRRLLEFVDPEGTYHTKALLPFLGKRLIDWQLEALRESPYVEGLYLLGLSEEDVQFDFPVHIVPCPTKADFADKLAAGLAYLDDMGKQPEKIVVSSCDTPGIRTAEINAFFDGGRGRGSVPPRGQGGGALPGRCGLSRRTVRAQPRHYPPAD